jgi:hypothetical protein
MPPSPTSTRKRRLWRRSWTKLRSTRPCARKAGGLSRRRELRRGGKDHPELCGSRSVFSICGKAGLSDRLSASFSRRLLNMNAELAKTSSRSVTAAKSISSTFRPSLSLSQSAWRQTRRAASTCVSKFGEWMRAGVQFARQPAGGFGGLRQEPGPQENTFHLNGLLASLRGARRFRSPYSQRVSADSYNKTDIPGWPARQRQVETVTQGVADVRLDWRRSGIDKRLRRVLQTRKPLRLCRTGWWWTQSAETGLPSPYSLVTGKRTGKMAIML